MTKVTKVRAAKDYPDFGIKKGDEHYTWSFFRQRPRRSLTPPTRSQLTASEFRSRLYDLIDGSLAAAEDADGMRVVAEEIRELGQEQSAKVDDMPENFQNGEQAEKLNNRETELEAFADEIESAADELGDPDDFKAEDSDHETYAEALAEKLEELDGSAPDPE